MVFQSVRSNVSPDRHVPEQIAGSQFQKLRPKHPEWQDDLPHTSARKKSAAVRPIETEVKEEARRRKFTAAYKAKILKAAEGLPDGQLAALLRREGLYSSHLYKWQRQRELASWMVKAGVTHELMLRNTPFDAIEK